MADKICFDLQELKIQRIRNNLTQEELASILGMSSSAYNQRERGVINISVEELLKITEILKIEDISIFFKKQIPECQ